MEPLRDNFKLNETDRKILQLVSKEDLPIMKLSKRVGIAHNNFLIRLNRLERYGFISRKNLKGRTTLILPNEERISEYEELEKKRGFRFGIMPYIDHHSLQVKFYEYLQHKGTESINVKDIPRRIRLPLLEDIVVFPQFFKLSLSEEGKKKIHEKINKKKK